MTPLNTTGWRIEAGAADADARAPLADGGELRLVFLSPTMARVSWQPAQGFKEPRTWAISPVTGRDVPWDGRLRASLEGFERPSSLSQMPSQLATERLAVRLLGAADRPVGLEWSDPRTGRVYQSDRATSAYLTEKRTSLLRHCVARDTAEQYFGLGDKTGPLNLHGRRLRCMGQDSLGYDAMSGDPLYKHWPFLLERTADGLWVGVYYDTLSACTFDLGCEHDNYHGLFRTVEIDDGDLDYYIMVGDTPAAVVAQFVRLIGGTHLPPRWSLGYAQTAMGLPDAPDAQQRLDAFVDQCVEHRMPISSFHYGSGYSSRGKQRYVFTWNRSKFPDPQAINDKFHAAGIRLVANLKPCLLDDHPAYEELARDGAFIQHEGSGRPVLEPFWDGQGSHLDFTRQRAVSWWQQQLKREILDRGIDVGWNDNNEYAIQAEDAYSDGRGQPIPMHRSRPLHSLLMTRATFEAQQSHASTQGDEQPVYTVTRAGPPGLQRYAQTWSGDNSTSWKTLKWNIRTGLQMSLSGMFNIGHDVGGFSGPVPSPELLLRWVQACSLNPRMVMNSWKTNGVTNLPWMHPEVEDAVRDAITLRYRLMPYLWQCVEQACRDGVPIIRPTFFNFPDDDQCFEDCDDFMLGDWLLVAPVVEEGLVRRRVYLPKLPSGKCWFALESRERYEGGRHHEVPAPLAHLPIFARQGARIPVSSPRPGKVAAHDDPASGVLAF
ncbi:TIM-barrel domain-containing protein [Castellaniella sp.]|uniref:glycoside hydrolase family 31 protein n=1 Tax=Castellaniella sp. TaxID=1955812 RepID=UPI003C761A9F